MAIDPAGNLYVIDQFTRLRKVAPDGKVSTVWTANGGPVVPVDGPIASATAFRFGGVATDRFGNVYVFDESTVRKISVDGIISTYAGFCDPVIGADFQTVCAQRQVDGVGTAARFTYPRKIVSVVDGTLYVVDNNLVVRQIRPGGVVSILAGSNVDGSGDVDATGTSARFSRIDGLTVAADGTVYLADTGNRTIRMITAAGVVTTVASNVGPSAPQPNAYLGKGFDVAYIGPKMIAVLFRTAVAKLIVP